jgi:hypothetical protein
MNNRKSGDLMNLMKVYEVVIFKRFICPGEKEGRRDEDLMKHL